MKTVKPIILSIKIEQVDVPNIIPIMKMDTIQAASLTVQKAAVNY